MPTQYPCPTLYESRGGHGGPLSCHTPACKEYRPAQALVEARTGAGGDFTSDTDVDMAEATSEATRSSDAVLEPHRSPNGTRMPHLEVFFCRATALPGLHLPFLAAAALYA